MLGAVEVLDSADGNGHVSVAGVVEMVCQLVSYCCDIWSCMLGSPVDTTDVLSEFWGLH